MKKASDILLLIGFIFGIVGAVFTLVLVIVLFAMGNSQEVIIQGLKEGTIHTSYVGTVEEQAAVVCALFRGLAIGALIGFFIEVALCVVAAITRKKQTSGFYIGTLVLSVLCGSILIIVGAILGLVDNSTNKPVSENQ